jgi:hypothetical protein
MKILLIKLRRHVAFWLHRLRKALSFDGQPELFSKTPPRRIRLVARCRTKNARPRTAQARVSIYDFGIARCFLGPLLRKITYIFTYGPFTKQSSI